MDWEWTDLAESWRLVRRSDVHYDVAHEFQFDRVARAEWRRCGVGRDQVLHLYIRELHCWRTRE